MNPKESSPLALFVKTVQLYEGNAGDVLHFYADGFPGLIFCEEAGQMHVLPQDKLMPQLFLFGMTIHPVELRMAGAYRFIAIQLFPFVLKSFFGLSPERLNDDCYDLTQQPAGARLLDALRKTQEPQQWKTFLSAYLQQLAEEKRAAVDPQIATAIRLILEAEGLAPVKTIRDAVSMTERTFERNFRAHTGVTPKQFVSMIRFQRSFGEVRRNDFDRLTGIVYRNGYADQSHFIRVFKSFTGKTPSQFLASE